MEHVLVAAFHWQSAGSARQSPDVTREAHVVLQVASAVSHMQRDCAEQSGCVA